MVMKIAISFLAASGYKSAPTPRRARETSLLSTLLIRLKGDEEDRLRR